jgi:hypothetical protein
MVFFFILVPNLLISWLADKFYSIILEFSQKHKMQLKKKTI